MSNVNFGSQDEPLITICLTTYNHEKYIEEAVESVMSQSIKNLCLIISDDASQDRTGEICRRLKEKYDSHIILIQHAKNIGLPESIELIYNYIPENTKYLSWFSGDDLMLPGKLSTQLRFLEENSDCIFCYHDMWVRDESTHKKYRYNDSIVSCKPYSGHISKKLIENGCFVCVLSVLIRYDLTKHIRFNKHLSDCNDWLYLIELSMEGKVCYLNCILGVYRRHTSNITRLNPFNPGPFLILDFLHHKYRNLDRSIKKGLVRQHLNYGWKAIAFKKYSKSLKEFKQASYFLLKYPSLLGFFICHNIKKILDGIIFFIKSGTLLK